jgi:hypothetical protein
MRYFYDTEFVENGDMIDLLSIGIVADDGREYYAVVNNPHTVGLAVGDDWLRANVVTGLPVALGEQMGRWNWDQNHPDFQHVKIQADVAREVADFLLGADRHQTGMLPAVELWADYAAYDHVVLAQLYGRMTDLPEGLPMYTHDLRQEIDRLGLTDADLPKQESGLHNALADARHTKRIGDHLTATEEADRHA